MPGSSCLFFSGRHLGVWKISDSGEDTTLAMRLGNFSHICCLQAGDIYYHICCGMYNKRCTVCDDYGRSQQLLRYVSYVVLCALPVDMLPHSGALPTVDIPAIS